jgi:nicotinamide-nucleotide amidase
MRKAHIISVGNELLIGDTVNTNASWLGSLLTEQGFDVEQVFTIPDSYEIITEKLSYSLNHASITVVTGGLGPTHDDITKKAVADLFGTEMVLNEEVLSYIQQMFARRGFDFSPSNREQAMMPAACVVLFNKKGTAPGMWFERNGAVLIVLPGVPSEMKYLMETGALPKIHEIFPEREVWATRYLKTAGIPESALSERIGDLQEFTDNGIGVAYLPSVWGVTIRISASGTSMLQAEAKLKNLKELISGKAGDWVYGEGKSVTLSQVVGELLTEQEFTLSTAESCTGGLLANEITNIPGSSRYMAGGAVAYANELKVSLLGVNQADLDQYGAVSKEVALQMAEGAAKHFHTDIGVSTTGIAGPGGGSDEKPVGTVYIGFWIRGDHFALRAQLTNDRLLNKERTACIALETIRRHLLKLEGLPYNLKAEKI